MGAKKNAKHAHQKAVERLAQLDGLVADAATVAEQRLATLDQLASRTGDAADQALATLRDATQEVERGLARLDGVLADAALVAEQRLAALDQVATRRDDAADQALATLRDAAQEAERHRTLAEETSAGIRATAADLEAHTQQQLAGFDRLAQTAAAQVESRREAAEHEIAAAVDHAVEQVRAEVDHVVGGLDQLHVAALGRIEAFDAELEGRMQELASTPSPPVVPATSTPTAEAVAPEPEPVAVVAEVVEIEESDDLDETDETDEIDEPTPPPASNDTADGPGGAPLAWAPTTPPPAPIEAPAAAAVQTGRSPSATLVTEPPGSSTPVVVQTSRAQMTASLTHLARSAADGWVRVEVVHSSESGQATSALRLTVCDASGWWEYHLLTGIASALARPSVVVDLAELLQAIELDRHAGDLLEIEVAGNVTVGAVLVLGRTSPIPGLAGERRKIERVQLGRANGDGLVLDSQIGRLVVPSRLASFLRSRRAEDIDLITIDGRPCLSAQMPSHAPGYSATIVAPLSDDEADHAPEDERRAAAASPISELVGALSSTSSPDELATIVANGVGYARRRAAAHPSLPEGLIAEMLREGTEAMRSAAASNPSIPVTSIERAASDRAPAVRAAIAGNPNVPPAILLRLARDDASQVRSRVVGNPALPAEMLVLLADDPDAGVRAAVAAHERCPVDTLVTMAHDPDPAVCAAAAQNPICPVELLDQLLAVVPEVVLANSRAPEHLLVAGSQVRARHLRAAVAANPSTPVRQLQLLARDPDPLIASALASNPSTPANVRRRARRRSERAEAGFGFDTDATDTHPSA